MLLSVEETPRIHGRAVNSNLVVEMGPCRPTAHADRADNLALLDLFSYYYEDSAEVCVEGCDAVAVVNHDASAVTRVGFSLNDQAVTGCEDVRADTVGDINAWMESILTAEGIHPLAESGGQSSTNRPDRRDGVRVINHAGKGAGTDPAACAVEAHGPDGAQSVQRAVAAGLTGDVGLPGKV